MSLYHHHVAFDVPSARGEVASHAIFASPLNLNDHLPSRSPPGMEPAARRAPEPSHGERPLAFDEFEAHGLWDRARNRVLALDVQALALGLQDSKRSLIRPGKISRAFGLIFGAYYPNALADPQLETLRRFGVLFQHGDITTEEIDSGLRSAGFADFRIAAALGMLGNRVHGSGNGR